MENIDGLLNETLFIVIITDTVISCKWKGKKAIWNNLKSKKLHLKQERN